MPLKLNLGNFNHKQNLVSFVNFVLQQPIQELGLPLFPLTLLSSSPFPYPSHLLLSSYIHSIPFPRTIFRLWLSNSSL